MSLALIASCADDAASRALVVFGWRFQPQGLLKLLGAVLASRAWCDRLCGRLSGLLALGDHKGFPSTRGLCPRASLSGTLVYKPLEEFVSSP